MNWHKEGLAHIWLPYTQMKTAAPPLPVVGAKGCRIQLADGRELIDGISSWWTACHGYRHPHIETAVARQLQALPHVMFGGLVHEPALTLATRLSALTGLPRVFFADSGSVAVEIALKMALQYWQNKHQGSRNRFLCFRYGYHGDTTGAMSVCDPDSMHKAFRNWGPMQFVVDIPSDEYGFAEFDSLLEAQRKHIAAVIIEPLVQGAGGMKFHSADVLGEIFRITKKHGLLFIADEIATGFGRTGRMFACEEAAIKPDLMCVGKGLTGGTMSLAATLASDEIFDAFLSDEAEAAFMHGPTYMANPLACASANASLDLFEKEPRLKQVEAIEAQMIKELGPCEGMDGVVDVRVKGAVGVVQIEKAYMDKPALKKSFVEEGVWLRPLEDVIYIMPPFVITQQELSKLTGTVVKVAGKIKL